MSLRIYYVKCIPDNDTSHNKIYTSQLIILKHHWQPYILWKGRPLATLANGGTPAFKILAHFLDLLLELLKILF